MFKNYDSAHYLPMRLSMPNLFTIGAIYVCFPAICISDLFSLIGHIDRDAHNYAKAKYRAIR